ncbi:Haloalkane dehalogenase [Nocardia sp. RB56]|uniref:Haloalkane dehalogenase n=1 Tax=Nocardia aurantia TaxID=2585199 RepID=A0A7K0DJP7_9NOCA|nr:alpha/beta hydrolase [Nocardia aurantia]MQY25939.1 Haloalkane dehalogenase [Nocardia aurantia]
MNIPGFETTRIGVAEDVELTTAVGGTGSPVVLLHGFPQTHLMWRHVAPILARRHTVICPDLRGYGASSKPVATGPDVYSKRTMAADITGLADALGVGRFAVVGHDRGAHVAFRAALDHPHRIDRLGILDIVPTLDTWNVLHGVDAAVAFHLYLMAQPPGLPEQMIAASADAFFGHFLDIWSNTPARFRRRCAPNTSGPAATPSRRSSPTTARPPRSTSTTTAPTWPPAVTSPCR